MPRGRGVLVVMNDWIHAAHSLTKTSTTGRSRRSCRRCAGLVGVANYGKNDFYSSPTWKHTTQTEFDVAKVSKLPRVDIIFASADMSPDLIDAGCGQRGEGHRHCRRRQRQHEQGVGDRRRERGAERCGRRAELACGDWRGGDATLKSTMTSWDSLRRTS
jgi:hypothetical protein